MFKNKFFNKIEIFYIISLLAFITQNLLIGYEDLGLFADDYGTIYQLNKIRDFRELLNYSINYDAARDLHQIWLKLFLIISGESWMQKLHLIQICIYLANSILFLYIMALLKISKITRTLIWILSIYFSAYAEVALWIHASSMILMSTFFFLIFIILNIKLLDKNLNKKKNLFYEIALIILSILSIETYEQPLFAIFLIFFIRFFANKFYKFNKIKFYSFTLFYLLLIISFSIFKLHSSLPYQTGSNINFLNDQFFFNILKSIALPIIGFYNFNQNSYLIKIFYFILFLLFIICLKKYLKDFKKKNYILLLNHNKKIILCLVLYIASFIPVYFHFISDRHFYIPSFFMFICIGFLLDKVIIFLKLRYKSLIVTSLPLLIIIIYLINEYSNFNKKKFNQIENFKIKINFYKTLTESKNINFFCNCFYENKIYMINFPDFYNKTIFFAHEQDVTLKLLFGENFPNIEKLKQKPNIKNSNNKKIYYITYLGIEKNKISFDITSN